MVGGNALPCCNCRAGSEVYANAARSQPWQAIAQRTADLPLSVLYAWQKVLAVPIAELLVEPEDALTQPVMQRARLVRLMKTALLLLNRAEQRPEQPMAQTLVDRLIEVMPDCGVSVPGTASAYGVA